MAALLAGSTRIPDGGFSRTGNCHSGWRPTVSGACLGQYSDASCRRWARYRLLCFLEHSNYGLKLCPPLCWISLPHVAHCDPGCQLPVEMLFPEAEYPPPDVVAALSELGVASRALPRAVGGKVAGTQEGTGHKTLEATLSGFTLKVAAVILSSFREVLVADLPSSLPLSYCWESC